MDDIAETIGKRKTIKLHLFETCPLKQNYNNSNQAFTTIQQREKHTSLYNEKKNQSIKSMASSR